MATLSNLPERALQLATQVGEGLKDAVPNKAVKWVETGAALAALRTGTRLATRIVRRNPVLSVAAVAGAGLLWYAARQRAKHARDGAGTDNGNGETIEGKATRVEARRGSRGNAGGAGPRTRRRRTPAGSH
jgi:hypothetical protein